MLRTALRNLFAHKARLMMTALAVVLGTAFVSGTLIFSDTVSTAYQNAMTTSLKDVAVSVTNSRPPSDAAARSEEEPADGEPTSVLNDQLARKLRALPGVASVRSTADGAVFLVGKDDQLLGDERGNKGTNYVPGKDGKDGTYPLKEGRAPAAAAEIALDAKTAASGGYKIGDTVRFAIDGPTLHKKLVGLVGTDDPKVTAGAGLALFDTATAQKLFTGPGQYGELVLAATPGTDDRALTAKVRQALPKDRAKATSGAELAAAEAKMIAAESDAMPKTLLSFAGIALFIGVFIIVNTFTMLIAQRSREIALLRAIGASRRQVVRSVLAEAGLLGLVSSAIGFALGLGIALGLRPLLNASGSGLPDGPPVIGAAPVLSSLAVGVLVTVLAAWLPARKAAKIAPVEALSTAEEPPAPRSLVLRNSIGAAVTAIGVAIMLYASTLRDLTGLTPAMTGAVLTMAGTVILAPLLSRPVIALAGNVSSRLFGITGKLAEQNAVRNPRRTAATASALVIGLVLITGMTVIGTSVQQTLDKAVAKDFKGDYQITTRLFEGLDPKMSRQVAQLPGVVGAAGIRSADYGNDGEYGQMTATDFGQLQKVTGLHFVSGSSGSVHGEDVAVSQSKAKAKGWKTGDTVKADFFLDKSSLRKLKVAAIYQDNHIAGDMLADTALVDPYLLKPVTDSKILVKAASGKADGLEREIRDALGNSPLLKVQDKDDLRREKAGQADTVLNMTYGLLGMAMVIAVLAVINTLAMSVFERTREIGMLRAIGLSRSGIRQMVRLESVVISLIGAVFGIGVGVFVAWMGSGLAEQALPAYEMALPWGRLGLFFLITLAVGVLAALWPARRASRLNILKSITTQ
ncbi:FtsX-like permease family protein [Streptomyces sp. NPDC005962]|uniref:ABC transporter permease n=1 Tax=Streptomyces sp. NPDC005962 TaxID=3154466 RepID=UPI0033C8A0A9